MLCKILPFLKRWCSRREQEGSGQGLHFPMERPTLPRRLLCNGFVFAAAALLIAFSRRWLADINCPTEKEFSNSPKESRKNNESQKRSGREDGKNSSYGSSKFWSPAEKKEEDLKKFSVRETVRASRLSRQQRSWGPTEQSQVSTPWETPKVNPSTNFLALTQKNGFLFSEEELNYWQTCQQNTSSVISKSRQVGQRALVLRKKISLQQSNCNQKG